jgi:hypothetical protein
MDLDQSGEALEAANRVLNRYLALRDAPGDFEAMAALPLFLSIRAAPARQNLRDGAQHMEAAERAAMQADARRFFDYAADVLEPRDVSLTVVGGLSGTGKSTIAQGLASTIGRTPGAIVLRSDILRKTLMGVAWQERLPAQRLHAIDEPAGVRHPALPRPEALGVRPFGDRRCGVRARRGARGL